METVVEVGSPRELKVLSSKTSVTITAQKITITSLKDSISGTNTPVLAISIIPELKVAPKITPTLATARMTQNGAVLEPTAELRKFEASLETPTKRSQQASAAKSPKRV